MDLRAKLDQLRSMEPPAALFEPPPGRWAELPQLPPAAAAERARQLQSALSAPVAVERTSSERPDLRRKLARLRSAHAPAALASLQPEPVGESDPVGLQLPAAVASLHEEAAGQLEPIGLQLSAADAAPRAEAAGQLEPIGLQLSAAELAAPNAQPKLPEVPLTAAEIERKARLRAAVRALQASQARFAIEAVPSADSASNGQREVFGSDLADRIARLRSTASVQRAEEGPSTAAAVPAKAERIAHLRSLIADISARDRLRAPTQSSEPREYAPPPWQQEPTEHGPLHVCKRYLEPDHHHGHSAVGAALYERPGALASLVCDPEYAGLDLSRALYLDTETTGLAGGTGTVAFLVGLARFEDDSLCVEQLIVPQLGSETPVLARLAERIAAASCLVTYNGKSFDWPLLRTRFVLARLPVPAVPPHIDLLHVCRRVWKQRLPSVRLVDMEREVLRYEREDDLPGSEIPARYFEFLRGGSPDRLCPVLEHNQNDLIALAALLGAVMEQYIGERTLCSPTDALHYGKIALRARDLDRARTFGEDALTHSSCQRQARAALTLCAEIEHKLGRVPEAIAHLERALEHAEQLSASAASDSDALAEAHLHFTLAKLYEHEQHDLVRALRHARNTELVEGPSLHGRRLGRLLRRLLRSADAKPP